MWHCFEPAGWQQDSEVVAPQSWQGAQPLFHQPVRRAEPASSLDSDGKKAWSRACTPSWVWRAGDRGREEETGRADPAPAVFAGEFQVRQRCGVGLEEGQKDRRREGYWQQSGGLEEGLWAQTARAPMILLALSCVSFVFGFLSVKSLLTGLL